VAAVGSLSSVEPSSPGLRPGSVESVRHARLGMLLTAVTAVVTGSTVLLLGRSVAATRDITVVAVAVLVTAAAALWLPWARLPRPALAVFPVLTMLQLASVGKVAGPTVGSLFTGFLVLAFLYTGSAASRTEVGLLVIPANATWLVLVGVLGDSGVKITQGAAIRFPVAVTVWLAVGLVTATHSSEQRHRHARLLGDASTDPLTGLGNRRALTPALARLCSGDAVVVVDIDQFREVNTRRGHSGADVVLAEFGQLVRVGLRGGDLAARTGGDEFVLLLVNVDPRLVAVVLGRVRESWQRNCGDVSFSAGAAFRRPGESAEVTLVRADRNCYRAKEAGRDRWVLADEAPAGPPGARPTTPVPLAGTVAEQFEAPNPSAVA